MTISFEVWRRRLWMWAAPLSFCLLNLIALVIYETTLEGGVETLASQHDSASKHLVDLRAARAEIESFLGRVEAHREVITGLYSEEFGTQSYRFTRAIREVKELARRAGLNPTSLSYPQKGLGYGLVERGISFSVEGTYDQMRNFINLLELSDQFLTLKSISLGESKGPSSNPTLGLRFIMSTIFASDAAIEVAPEDAET